MQPYFMPYLGYWQLAKEVDLLVLSDDTKYVKQSWINRNRIWENGNIGYITIPIKSDSDYLPINLREISNEFDPNRLMRKILQQYPVRANLDAEDFLRKILYCNEKNLSQYLFDSIKSTLDYLGISTPILFASSLEIPKELKGKERIFYLSSKLEIRKYVNLPGGKNLYSKNEFFVNGIDLEFISPKLSSYSTLGKSFEPGLSIIDLLFNIEKEEIKQVHLLDYSLE